MEQRKLFTANNQLYIVAWIHALVNTYICILSCCCKIFSTLGLNVLAVNHNLGLMQVGHSCIAVLIGWHLLSMVLSSGPMQYNMAYPRVSTNAKQNHLVCKQVDILIPKNQPLEL